MSKFNKQLPKSNSKQLTVNLAGGQAYKQSDKFQFACILLTSFLRDQFYSTEKETVERIKTLLTKVSPEFAAKTAVYARREFGMRSISHFVASEIAKNVKGETWTAPFFQRVVRRPDDLTEILSCYMSQYGKPIPNSLKRGLGRAMSSLDESALAKYKQSNAALSMVDAANLLHPPHTKALRKLIKGTLPIADTWETAITQVGQNIEEGEDIDAAKGKEWANLVKEGKLKYMALVRNLRNILTYAPEVSNLVCQQLKDEKAIRQSLMFPYRFLTAIDIVKNISGSSRVLDALNDAMEISLQNVPVFEGNTLIALDESGSMSGKPAQIGALFAATLLKTNPDNADLLMFANDGEYKNISTRDSLSTIVKNIGFAGGGTNFTSIFEEANKKYDRVIILSDMQGWIGGNCPTAAHKTYCKKYKCDPKIYSFDLQGYGTLQFPEKNVYCLAGFSDKVFTILGLLEHDENALLTQIEETEFETTNAR